MLSALDISTSGMVAQRQRMLAVSNNLANIDTTRNAAGEVDPYRRRFVVFKTDEGIGTDGAAGVRVDSVEMDASEPLLRYEPNHPDANAEGYVAYPNVNMMFEMVDAMETARSYEANIGAFEIAKDLQQQTLRILA